VLSAAGLDDIARSLASALQREGAAAASGRGSI
jgi:hypothetical protein